jgi:hypothetical protein
METKDEEPKKSDERTPIIDGDARPDLNIHGDAREESRDHPIPIPGEKEKKSATTRNRNDRNSLEDYKDARLD